MREEVLYRVSWMQEFRFTVYENTYVKTALVRNGSDIGYMAISGEVFWASRDAIVLVEDGPSTFFSGER